MADSVAPTTTTDAGFDPGMINEFKKGVFYRDPERVKRALDAKIDVDTPVKGRPPLQMLVGFDYSDMPEDIRKQVSEDDFEARTTAIVNMLFEHGAKVAEPEKYASRNYNFLADRLVLADNLADLSTVVMHAIHETLNDDQKPYQPDVKKVVTASLAGAGENVDLIGHVNSVLSALERLHNTVRHRLENPTSELEKQIVAQHGARVKEITKPFKRPPVRSIIEDLFPNGPIPQELDQQLSQLGSAFEGRGRNKPNEYVVLLEKKPVPQVLAEIKDNLVGLNELKRDARRLAFRKSFDAATNDTASPDRLYGEVIMGNEGLGKSDFASKKAELLVALGLAGDRYVEFSQKNSNAATIGLPPKALAAIFAEADIINLEIPEPIHDGRAEVADFGRRLIGALQLSLEGRDKPPVLFLSGKPETINEVLTNNPTLKNLIAGYTRLEDMTPFELSQVLDRKLGEKNLTIDDGARTLVLKAIEDARKDIGAKDFTNAYEVANIVTRLPDAIAERIFGKEDKGVPADATEMHRVTADDVSALNLKKILAGPLLARKQQIGF